MGGTITANFTIFWATSPGGEYQAHTASILDYPSNFQYGAVGNWNPAPIVHPNGTVYIMVNSGHRGYKQGKAIIGADSWRGPYRVVAVDCDYRLVGCTWVT